MSKSKAVSVGEGEECPKCGELMERFKHSAAWKPREGHYWFKRWDKCEPCGHTQLYEKFKMDAYNATSPVPQWPSDSKG